MFAKQLGNEIWAAPNYQTLDTAETKVGLQRNQWELWLKAQTCNNKEASCKKAEVLCINWDRSDSHDIFWLVSDKRISVAELRQSNSFVASNLSTTHHCTDYCTDMATFGPAEKKITAKLEKLRKENRDFENFM